MLEGRCMHLKLKPKTWLPGSSLSVGAKGPGRARLSVELDLSVTTERGRDSGV